MWKSYKFKKKYHLSFETFNKERKKISNVYKTGIRNWKAMDADCYSLVLHRFRIVFSVDKEIYASNG